MPSRARSYGGSVVIVRAVEARSRPSVTGTRPIRHFSSVVLPTPLRPSSAVTAPGGASKRDVAQDVAAAVVLVESRLDAVSMASVDALSVPR